MKKLIISKSGVASVIDPGQDDFNTVENPGNIKALEKRMSDDLVKQADLLKCSVANMPMHALKAALNGIFWKHISIWSGSRKEFNTAFGKVFKAQLALLESAGQRPELGAEVREMSKTGTKRFEQGKRWGEILDFANAKFGKHPDKLTAQEFESLKFDLRAKSQDLYRELMSWFRKVRPAQVGVSQQVSAEVSDAVLAEINQVEEINANLDLLIAEMAQHEVAWLRIAGQAAIKLHGPQIRVGSDNKLRIGHVIGNDTFIPAWETDIVTQPIVQIRKESPDMWTLMAQRDSGATVTINFESKSDNALPVLARVGARDPWDLHSNDEMLP